MDAEAKQFLTEKINGLLAEWPMKPEIEIVVEDQAVTARIRTGKDFIFTQPTAQPLLALQHLLRLMFKKQFPEYPKKLLVDIGDFRERQLQANDQVTKEAIWQTKASGNSVHLSPMSSFERRLVHMRIVEEPNLSSESIGTGDDRHVVIKLSKE